MAAPWVLALLLVADVALAQPAGPAPADDARADSAPRPAAGGGDTGTPAQPPAGWRLMLSDLSAIRLNPLGLETRARLGLQKRLYPSDEPISHNNFVFFGAYPRLSPASAYATVGGEIQPLSIFNLRGTVGVQKYFGTFGSLQSFVSPDRGYSDHALDELATMPGFEPQSATVFHASLQPLIQMRLGPIAVRALLQLDYWDMKLRTGDTVAYEPTLDTLLPDGGLTLATDTDLLYTGRPGLAIGLRHSWIHPIYESKHFADPALSPAENEQARDAFDSRNSHQRLGLFAAYTLRDRGPSAFNKPTIILIASWYLTHRYRTGLPDTLGPSERADDFTSRAFPYLLLAFAFESELLASR